jgi:hypothetical protein
VIGPEGHRGPQGPPGPTGPSGSTCDLLYFSESIEYVGCTAPGVPLLGENHIWSTTGGTVEPKNIELKTDGSNEVFGNLQRRDTLTTVLGDKRGSGAVDLSVRRNLCSQVASGDFSVLTGGFNNTSGSTGSVVGGGESNTSVGLYSVIGGGRGNTASGNFSFVGGGQLNNNTGIYSVIGGGINNFSSSDYTFIGGGGNNKILSNSTFAGIASGVDHTINAGSTGSFIGSGRFNSITGQNSVIMNGGLFQTSSINNQIIGNLCMIGTGTSNKILDNNNFATILNGNGNNIFINSDYSVIGSGFSNNIIRNEYSSIVSGTSNGITGQNVGRYNFIGSGLGNTINNSNFSTIGDGSSNTILGSTGGSIGSGTFNNIPNCEYAVIFGGLGNTASANSCGIGGGTSNVVSVANSFVAGSNLSLTISGSTAGLPSAAFGQWNFEGSTGATGSITDSQRIFMIGNGSSLQRRNAFSVTQNGVVLAQSTYLAGGADFAEYFENYNSQKIDLYKTVTFINQSFVGSSDSSGYIFRQEDIGKIIEYDKIPSIQGNIQPNVPFGVVSNSAAFIGNMPCEDVIDCEYPHLNIIGLLGQIKILKNQVKNARWIKIKDLPNEIIYAEREVINGEGETIIEYDIIDTLELELWLVI